MTYKVTIKITEIDIPIEADSDEEALEMSKDAYYLYLDHCRDRGEFIYYVTSNEDGVKIGGNTFL